MEEFRKKGPLIKMIGDIRLPEYQSISLDNGIPLYKLSQGTQDILKLELVFHAGRPYEHKKVVSRACNNQIKEGTTFHNTKEISDRIDYFGASLRTSETLDQCSVQLFCLSKYFNELLPIISEILCDPIFPEKELQKFISLNSERLKIDLSKNDVIAYRTITQEIFGKTHPYGYNSEIEDYNALQRKDLIRHFDDNYGWNNAQLFISGRVNNEHVRMLNKEFGNLKRKSNPKFKLPEILNEEAEYISIQDGNEFQKAIKIGRKLFNRSHKDYPGMYFLNTILGGFFGSRLMSNIREDKGFTYHIYSDVDVMEHGGMFMVATEIGKEHEEQTFNEIFKEFDRLKNELVSNEELEMVKNYLLGRILNFVDGPFNSSRMVKSIITGNLGPNYFDRLIFEIKEMNADRLAHLANQYLDEDKMWKVSVGK